MISSRIHDVLQILVGSIRPARCQRLRTAPEPERLDGRLTRMMRPMASADDARLIRDLFEAHHGRVLAYALRRTATEADAEDAASETFAVAWRRIGNLPADPLPWLYAITRRVLANQRRSGLRRIALRLRLARAGPPPADLLGEQAGPAIMALLRLRQDDQELLRLVAWEGLRHAQIAASLGISVNAVSIRLHRARRRFAALLAADDRGVKGFASSRTSRVVTGSRAGTTGQEDVR